jgi:hypothetical protein
MISVRDGADFSEVRKVGVEGKGFLLLCLLIYLNCLYNLLDLQSYLIVLCISVCYMNYTYEIEMYMWLLLTVKVVIVYVM